MRRLAVALVLALAPVTLAAQWPGARVAVVAYANVGWLTLCPMFGREVVEVRYNPAWAMGVNARVMVGTSLSGQQSFAFYFDRGVVGRAVLPTPTGRGEQLIFQADVDGRREMEDGLRRKTRHVVVPSPEMADYVLVIESRYSDVSRAMAAPRDKRQPGIDWFTRANANGMFRHIALAMLVPARAYREHPYDANILIASSLWHGMAYSEWKMSNDGDTIREAALVTLAEQIYGQVRQLPDYLPLCPVEGQS